MRQRGLFSFYSILSCFSHQALLDYARLPRQGYKRDLLLRCKLLITSKWSPQLATQIQQINLARIHATRPMSSARQNNSPSPIVLCPTESTDNLPMASHVQYVHLPFFDVLRTIESTNMSIHQKSTMSLHFVLTDFDVDLLLNGVAKVFLRLAPTLICEKQNDVLPSYLFVQCNVSMTINNTSSIFTVLLCFVLFLLYKTFRIKQSLAITSVKQLEVKHILLPFPLISPIES
jgi:hypothetical protein